MVSKLCTAATEKGLVGKVDEGVTRGTGVLCASFKMDFRIRISASAAAG